jgi:hypothetical protein
LNRASRLEKSEEIDYDRSKLNGVQESLKMTFEDPVESYKNYLSNPSGKMIDEKTRVSLQEEEATKNMSTAELFGLNDVFASLTADEKKVVDVFVEEFNSLKKLRVDREFEDAKKASQDKKSQKQARFK